MTRDFPAESWWRKVLSNLLLALVAALGTHLFDVFKVKDLVDQIHDEQITNSKARIKLEAQMKEVQETQLPSLIHGQYILNKRLCELLERHGAADEECSSRMWIAAIK